MVSGPLFYINHHFPRDVSKSPSYWSRVCLYNMAKLAKEATTVRRVFEPLFHHFDTQDQWSFEKGLACSALTFMQLLLDESGYIWISIADICFF